MPKTKTLTNGAPTNGAPRKRRLPPVEIGGHLISDPEVYHGELTFKGTRIPVKTILTFLSMGDNLDGLLKGFDHPRLRREAIRESVTIAKRAMKTLDTPTNGRKPKLIP